MRREPKKILALLLTAAMLVGTVIPAAAADTASAPSETEAVTEAAEETQEEVVKEEAEAAEEMTEASEEATEAADPEISVVESTLLESGDSELRYLYIEKPYLAGGEEQNIVAALGEQAEDAVLVLEDSKGEKTEIACETSEDGLLLFKKVFEDKEETYVAERIRYTAGGEAKELVFAEVGIKAYFGVNREADAEDESFYQEIDAPAVGDEVSASVVKIEPEMVDDETAQLAVANEILESAGESPEAVLGDLITESKTAPQLETSIDGKYVVILDPGHDNKHSGARGNDVLEEVVTLKIAQYCKQELAKYSNIEVYLTHETLDCPFPDSTSNIDDIKKRVAWSAAKNADIYVSFHLDSAGAAANGAHVYYPASFAPQNIQTLGKNLATEIQNQLVAIGLYNRGVQTGDYCVNVTCSEYGFPGIIIEHAFLTNAEDAEKYLKTEEGIKSLGVADAKGIVNYLSKNGSTNVAEGTYYIESALDSNKVLGIRSGSWDNFAVAELQTKGASPLQKFEIVKNSDGSYTLRSELTGKVLDINGGSSEPGATVQQYESNWSAAQKWGFLSAGEGYYNIRSILGTVLDVQYGQNTDGTPINAYTLNNSAAQKWKLVPVENRPIEDGTYTIGNNGMVLDIFEASTENSANVQVYPGNDSSAQRFEVAYIGGGYYRITSEISDKVLDIVGGSTTSGANVQQYEWNASTAQLWKFIDAGDGTWYIRSKSGLTLDVNTIAPSPYTNVTANSTAQSASQRWNVKKSDCKTVAEGNYVITSAKNSWKAISDSAANLVLYTFDINKGQIYQLKYVGGCYYSIINPSTGKAVDIAGASAADYANLQLYESNGTDAQLFKFIKNNDGTYYIKSKLGTVIDLSAGQTGDGTNIQMFHRNFSDAQKWNLDSAKASMKEQSLPNGTFLIKNATDSEQVLDVNGGSAENYANIQTYKANGSAAQNFEIYYVGDGYYRIWNEASGKALDISGGSKEVGANVQQYEWNGSDAQLFKFFKCADGNYIIKSKTGTVLGIKGTQAKSGVNVQMDEISDKKQIEWTMALTGDYPVAEGTYKIAVSVDTNLVLDIAGGSTKVGGNAQIYTSNGSEAQKFEVKKASDGYYKIKNVQSGLLLGVKDGNPQLLANVEQTKGTSDDTQLWKFISDGKKGYYIKNKSGYVLDIYGGNLADASNVHLYSINFSAAQRWKFETTTGASESVIARKEYMIETALAEHHVLDVADGSTQNYGNIQLYTANYSGAQTFLIEQVNGNYYKIQNTRSGKVLDILEGSSKSGANVQQYEWNGSDAQLWEFVDAGGGYYYIQSKLGTVLDAYGASYSNYTNVHAYELNKSTAQKWKLIDDFASSLTTIMGKTSCNVNQMVAAYKYVVKYKAGDENYYPYSDNKVAPTINDFCRIYLEEANKEGVKGEVAFAQAMLETGYLCFGGDVQPQQYNFAGIGATGGGVPGNDFKAMYGEEGIRIGIRAQIQHLKAYATEEPLNQECVDPRYSLVKKGNSPYVEWLGKQENPYGYGWAVGANYGYNILKVVDKILSY